MNLRFACTSSSLRTEKGVTMSLRYLRKYSLHFLLASGFAILLGPSSALAQTSQVSGQVVDASKAAVPNAQLTLTRVESGDTRQQHSTNEGYYSFPLLLPGHYDLKVERDGYETQDQKGIIVETGTVSTVNVILAVGAIAQTVSVDATVPLLQSQSSAVEDVVENQTITNMPLIDRRSSQLQRLSGFVVGNGTGSSATFAVGGRPREQRELPGRWRKCSKPSARRADTHV
jgi:hypothetical protein